MKDRIKILRKSLGMTQQKMADRLHIKASAISNYEIGRNIPVDSVIALICREFNVSEPWLRDGVGEMFVARTMNQELTSMINDLMSESDDSFRKRFIAALLELPSDFWPEIQRFIGSLTK